jgi:hypothetical protein
MRSPFKNGGKSSLGIPKSLSAMEFSTISSQWELCHRIFYQLDSVCPFLVPVLYLHMFTSSDDNILHYLALNPE